MERATPNPLPPSWSGNLTVTLHGSGLHRLTSTWETPAVEVQIVGDTGEISFTLTVNPDGTAGTFSLPDWLFSLSPGDALQIGGRYPDVGTRVPLYTLPVAA